MTLFFLESDPLEALYRDRVWEDNDLDGFTEA